jgi:diguanylate cyclase (GGDEF)-like protein
LSETTTPQSKTKVAARKRTRRRWVLPHSTGAHAHDELRATTKTIGELGWLMLVVVLGYLAFIRQDLEVEAVAATLGAMLAYALFVLALQTVSAARSKARYHTFGRCLAMIALITWVLLNAGGERTALANLYHLVIITSALTLGGRLTAINLAIIAAILIWLEHRGAPGGPSGAQRALGLFLQLAPMLLVAFITTRLAGDIRKALDWIRFISETDELTSLYNLRAFMAIAERLHRQAKRYKRAYALMMIDSDSLKSVNDTYGHDCGNELLKLTTNGIRRQLRDTDVPARYGGDEFILLLPETNAEGAGELAERIRRAIAERPLHCEDNEIHTTVSIGIASFPDHGEDFKQVLNKADQAMYASKKSGRNRVTLSELAEA